MGAAARSEVSATRLRLFALAAAALLSGCGRGPEPSAAGPSAVARPAALPPDLQKAQEKLESLADQTRVEQEQDKKDRAELVTPAPPGFKPKVSGRKLELTLIPQKKMLRVGETFWYRAEIRNVGSQSVTVTDSFVKSGYDYYGAKFKIIVSPRHWKDHSVLRDASPCEASGLPIPGWTKMDKSQQVEAAKRYHLEEELKNRVRVLLEPGETVRTQDERYVSQEEDCAAFQAGKIASTRPGGLFRQYYETRDFDRPGTYLLKLVLTDPPRPLSNETRTDLKADGFTEDEIAGYEVRSQGAHLGVAESGVVEVEVVR